MKVWEPDSAPLYGVKCLDCSGSSWGTVWLDLTWSRFNHSFFKQTGLFRCAYDLACYCLAFFLVFMFAPGHSGESELFTTAKFNEEANSREHLVVECHHLSVSRTLEGLMGFTKSSPQQGTSSFGEFQKSANRKSYTATNSLTPRASLSFALVDNVEWTVEYLHCSRLFTRTVEGEALTDISP